jgi:tripartite-type tricarboxylate transporter receptor subunit TctC
MWWQSVKRVLDLGTTSAALAGALCVIAADSAWADYPDKPVRIVIPNSAGGPSDIMGRVVAPMLQEALGSSFVVENVGGGGGNIGMGRVARAEPDGYTLLLATTTFIINPSLYPNPNYDPIKDFVPIAELGASPNVFAVLPSLGVKSVAELLTLARLDMAKFNIASPPIGSSSHLAVEMFKLRTDLKEAAVVFHTGGGQALQALLANTVQVNIGVLAPIHPHIKSGNVVGLAVTGTKRWHDLPEIPTMIELGYKDFVTENLTALVAPAKTPPAIVAGLEKAVLTGLAKQENQQRLVQGGFAVSAKTGKEFHERLERDVPMFRKLIQDAGIKMPGAK